MIPLGEDFSPGGPVDKLAVVEHLKHLSYKLNRNRWCQAWLESWMTRTFLRGESGIVFKVGYRYLVVMIGLEKSLIGGFK